MSSEILFEKYDEIQRFLRSTPWIKSYELYLLQTKSLYADKYEDVRRDQEEYQNIGSAVRIISDNNRFVELNLSMSSISQLQNLDRPKSTVSKISIDNFPHLKQPRTLSIENNRPEIEELNMGLIRVLTERADAITKDYDIPFFEKFEIVQENRLISNTGSPILSDSAIWSKYSISTKFDLKNVFYNIYRTNYSRGLDIDFELTIKELVNAVINRIKLSRYKGGLENPVIFHPDIIGKMIAFHFMNYINNRNESQPLNWSPYIQLYDDPHRKNGYYSYLFDDEGTLTKPKLLVDNGRLNSTLDTLSNNKWVKGGNGYRSEWFQPVTHSYKYEVRPTASNLILIGGTGKGNRFLERPGKTLYIRQGYGYTGLGSNSSQFILHANEIDVWQNGEQVGYLPNLTIYGDLNKILEEGQLSSDEIEVIDESIPGAVYTGWLAMGTHTVKIR